MKVNIVGKNITVTERVFASFSLKSDSFKNFFDFISALYKVFFLFWIIFFLSNLIYCLCS